MTSENNANNPIVTDEEILSGTNVVNNRGDLLKRLVWTSTDDKTKQKQRKMEMERKKQISEKMVSGKPTPSSLEGYYNSATGFLKSLLKNKFVRKFAKTKQELIILFGTIILGIIIIVTLI